jgi:PDZ domain
MKARKAILAVLLIVPLLETPARTALSPQQNASPTSQSAAPFQFALGGNAAEIPAQFVGNRIFLPVRINDGKASLFELDSSASASTIDSARAAALGLDIQSPSGAQPGSPKFVRNCVMSLPGVDVPMSSLATVTRDEFGSQVGKAYEGTLGGDFFARFVIQIDYGRRTVRVYDPSSYRYSGPGASFPLTFSGDMPVVRAKFSTASKKDIEADFVVNTALDAPVVILDRYAETHRLFSSREKMVSSLDPELGLRNKIALGRAKEFRIGRYKAQEAIIEFTQVSPFSGDAGVAGEIGGGMLRRFTVIFDYPHRKIILEPNSSFQDDDQEDKSGISVIAKGPGLKTFQIVQVQPGTPAAEAGIQQGDVIAGIDDEAAADLSLADIRDLFRQVGHIYKVLIDRDGKTMPITLQMRRLLAS